jgi:DNA-binding SARP family transcriptional activator/Tfp pilus assembly protein PilF
VDAEFCLLGPLLVRARGAILPALPGKQRVLLATLLLQGNRMVALDQIVEALWGDKPPASAHGTLRDYVKELRKQLAVTGESRIGTVPGGYVFRIGPGELDLLSFEELRAEAMQAARDRAWARASDRWCAAELLWRGEPLADVPSELLRAREVPRLAEMRVQALESRIEADLQLGRHAEVIADLRQLAVTHPLRERLHALLMLALYRDGQQAAAQAAFRDVREVLIEELGTEPGAELQRLHQQILAADPALDLPAPAHGGRAAPQTAAGHPAVIVPRQLPAAVTHFTGRAAELAELTALLDQAGSQATGTVVISAIGGTAGVGKTALAVHWAHKVADRFGDGQLYVNLRGYDPGQPVPAADTLAAFLRSLGVPGQDIPPEADERAARYRSLLAGKQVLIVLDNAGSADQVRPLLPGTPACTVVVTSRDALAGLVAMDGAVRLDLDLLPLAEAVALLQTLIGPRADAEPDAAAELAAQCCRLPLALRVAAELAAGRPAASLAGLTGELTDLRTRLDLLGADNDPRTQVRAVFSWSYQQLGTDAAQMFRLLGLHPGPDVEPYAAAALTGTALPQARRALDALDRAHLISPTAPRRYGMHDLLRAYAREVSATVDSAQERHAALTRLFDHYLHSAAAATDTQFPAERHQRPRIPRPDTPVPPLADPVAARQWLDDERTALVAVAAHTATHGWPGHATRLAATISSYLLYGGHIPEAVAVFNNSLGAARHTGDRAAEARALNQIGNVDWQQGRYQQAGDHYRQALALYRTAGDRTDEARVLTNLGLAETDLGRYAQAARYQQEAIAINRDIGNRFGEARALSNLGVARQLQGHHQEAADHFQQSLDLSREIGDRKGEAWALASLGAVDLRLGRYQHAAGYLQQAIAMLHEMGDTRGESDSLLRLGEVHLELGRYQHAAGNFEQALAMSREIGARIVEADALNGLGNVLFRTGETGKACAHHAAALRLASEASVPLEQARAHSGLARACQADGNSLQARHHWQQALTHYAAIGAPEAREIRARLAMAGDSGDDDDKPTEENRGAPAPSPG